MKNYVSDELANKVYHLTQALNQAEKIIKSLQEENDHLKEIIEQEQNALFCAVGE
jgi:hypothetical protein